MPAATTIRELERFLLKSSLRGHKNAAGLGNLMEASGRENIMRRIAAIGSDTRRGPPGETTRNMLRDAAEDTAGARMRFFEEPTTDQDMAEAAMEDFRNLFGRRV